MDLLGGGVDSWVGHWVGVSSQAELGAKGGWWEDRLPLSKTGVMRSEGESQGFSQNPHTPGV